jgi:hypothetical protein
MADPAAWMPQQHPAVQMVLKADLAAAAAASSAAHTTLQGAQPFDCADADSCSRSSASVLQAAGQRSSSTDRRKQQRALQLLVPQFPCTPPTLVFVTGQQEEDSTLQLLLHRQQQQQQECEALPLPSVKMYVRYFGVANNTVKQVRLSGAPTVQYPLCREVVWISNQLEK